MTGLHVEILLSKQKVSIDPEFDDEYSSDEEYRDLEEKLTKKSKKEKR